MRQAEVTWGAQQRLQDAARLTLRLHTCNVKISMDGIWANMDLTFFVSAMRAATLKQNYHSLVIKPHKETNPPWKLDILLFHSTQYYSPRCLTGPGKFWRTEWRHGACVLAAHKGHRSEGKESKSRGSTVQQCAAAEAINTNKTFYVTRAQTNHRLRQRSANQSIQSLATLLPSTCTSFNTVCN